MRTARLTLALMLAALPVQAVPKDQSVVTSLARLAELGNAEAAYHLAMAYHTGLGVEQDKAKALALFQKAAALGDPLAEYKLGCYYDGQGDGLVPHDPQLAFDHKLNAAKAGYALAQQDVAAMLAARGDTAQALAWIERSAAQGWPDGLRVLSAVYNGAPGVPRDPVKTAAFFRLYLMTTTGATAFQTDWLKRFEDGMSQDQQEHVLRVVENFQPVPTPLTLKALLGERAALELIKTAK